ncbi:hypothetical protein AB4Z50_35005 [Paenibacillus sp. 2TAB26]|uniref:hypothetical protein n=1 Tax=Paenibacillus sp. 2TAB26 TaxID=3233005 RepID=UPI003F991B83
MIQSDHIQLRYVQRVLGIANENEAQAYLNKNKYKIYYDLDMLFNKSELIHDRFSPDKDGIQYNYYLGNYNILFVISFKTNVGVTLYKIKNDEVNTLFSNIRRNNDAFIKLDSKKTKHDDYTRKLEFMIDELRNQLTDLEKNFKLEIEVGRDYASDLKEIRGLVREDFKKILYGFKNR